MLRSALILIAQRFWLSLRGNFLTTFISLDGVGLSRQAKKKLSPQGFSFLRSTFSQRDKLFLSRQLITASEQVMGKKEKKASVC